MLKDAVGQPPLTWLTCGKAPDAQYLTARSAKERASAKNVSEAAEIDTSTQLSSNTRTVLRRGAVQNVTEAVNLRLRLAIARVYYLWFR